MSACERSKQETNRSDELFSVALGVVFMHTIESPSDGFFVTESQHSIDWKR
jgi:hypothetical protein